jgi:hypothetical protein
LGCGAKTDRANMRRAVDQLDAGDVLMVTRLDRLAGKIRAPLARHIPRREPRATLGARAHSNSLSLATRPQGSRALLMTY